MPNKVKEIVMYKIKDGLQLEFDKLKTQMIGDSCAITGLFSSVSSKSLDQDNVYIDTMIWESKALAEASFPEFQALPLTQDFFALMDGKPLFHQFLEYIPDNIAEL
ncbi:MAG: putative metal-dependent RNase [Flavobacteriales bacterium]|jgi:predicted metal-dependent RNase